MLLELKRKWYTKECTIGELYVEGEMFCYTLEDIVRPKGEKVQGETAIPAGKYKVVLDHSERFNQLMPHVLDVPGFEGVRIHPGNTAKDTEGCILVGDMRTTHAIYESRKAYSRLFALLQNSVRIEPVTLVIR